MLRLTFHNKLHRPHNADEAIALFQQQFIAYKNSVKTYFDSEIDKLKELGGRKYGMHTHPSLIQHIRQAPEKIKKPAENYKQVESEFAKIDAIIHSIATSKTATPEQLDQLEQFRNDEKYGIKDKPHYNDAYEYLFRFMRTNTVTEIHKNLAKGYDTGELLLDALISSQETKDEDYSAIIKKLHDANKENPVKAYAIALYRNRLPKHPDEKSPPYSQEKLRFLLQKLKPQDTSEADFQTSVFHYAVNQYVSSVKEGYGYNRDFGSAVDYAWEEVAAFQLQSNVVNPEKSIPQLKVILNSYNDEFFIKYATNIAAQKYLLINAIFEHYCQQYRIRSQESKDKDSIKSDDTITDGLNNCFAIAIRDGVMNAELTLLTKFHAKLTELGFQPTIKDNVFRTYINLESIGLHRPAYAYESIVDSRLYAFLNRNYPSALAQSLTDALEIGKSDKDLQAVMQVCKSPLRLGYDCAGRVTPDEHGRRDCITTSPHIRIYDSEAIKTLNTIKEYIIELALKKPFSFRKYSFCFFEVSGGKNYNLSHNLSVRLPHGFHKFVSAADAARKNPARASILLGEVLRHAANTAPHELLPPVGRDPVVHQIYLAIAKWDESSSIIKDIQQKMVVEATRVTPDTALSRFVLDDKHQHDGRAGRVLRQ